MSQNPVTSAPQTPDDWRIPTALMTDHYELTMLQAALKAGTAHRRSRFELFTRRLPSGRRYGVVAGVGRALEGLSRFRFDTPELDFLADTTALDDATLAWLADYEFTGDIVGYAEGEAYFPHSPLLQVESTFAEACILETYLLSIYNYDSAVASAASRMTAVADGRPCAEMGSRRTHEESAVAAARAAAIAGFTATSNLEAGPQDGPPAAASTLPPRPRARRRRPSPRTSRRAAGTASRPSAPPPTPSPCCTTRSAPPSRPRSPRSGRTPASSWTRMTWSRACAPRSRWPARPCGTSGSTPATS